MNEKSELHRERGMFMNMLTYPVSNLLISFLTRENKGNNYVESKRRLTPLICSTYCNIITFN